MELLSTGNVFFFYTLFHEILSIVETKLSIIKVIQHHRIYTFLHHFLIITCELIRINKPDKYYLKPITRTFDSKVLSKQIFHLYDKHLSSSIIFHYKGYAIGFDLELFQVKSKFSAQLSINLAKIGRRYTSIH